MIIFLVMISYFTVTMMTLQHNFYTPGTTISREHPINAFNHTHTWHKLFELHNRIIDVDTHVKLVKQLVEYNSTIYTLWMIVFVVIVGLILFVSISYNNYLSFIHFFPKTKHDADQLSDLAVSVFQRSFKRRKYTLQHLNFEEFDKWYTTLTSLYCDVFLVININRLETNTIASNTQPFKLNKLTHPTRHSYCLLLSIWCDLYDHNQKQVNLIEDAKKSKQDAPITTHLVESKDVGVSLNQCHSDKCL